MTPLHCANSISGRFRRCIRHADIDGFISFTNSNEFLQLLAGAGPRHRRGLLLSYARVLKRVEERARVVKPKGQGESKTRWSAGMRDKLSDACAKGLSDEAVGRLLGITAGAARLARKRFLCAATAAQVQNCRGSRRTAIRMDGYMGTPESRSALSERRQSAGGLPSESRASPPAGIQSMRVLDGAR